MMARQGEAGNSAHAACAITAARRTDAGFTLIEVLMVVAILAVLMSMAGPPFVRLIADQRAKSTATDLFMALNVTRSEAIKHNANVTLTPKSGDWQNGWVVADPDGGANLLDRNGTSVTVSGAPSGVTYNGSGRLTSTTVSPAFTIGASGDPQRCVMVDLSGRPYTKASAC